ncbi:MAG: hypothetical protein AAF662_01465 [Pseudomonadota bacterium]
MNRWSELRCGSSVLDIGRHRISLPVGFRIEHESEGFVNFIGETPDGSESYVIHDYQSIEQVIEGEFGAPEHKVTGRTNCLGLELVEVAPTTKSGRAQPMVRFVLVKLSRSDTLVVLGGGVDFATSLIRRTEESP